MGDHAPEVQRIVPARVQLLHPARSFGDLLMSKQLKLGIYFIPPHPKLVSLKNRSISSREIILFRIERAGRSTKPSARHEPGAPSPRRAGQSPPPTVRRPATNPAALRAAQADVPAASARDPGPGPSAVTRCKSNRVDGRRRPETSRCGRSGADGFEFEPEKNAAVAGGPRRNQMESSYPPVCQFRTTGDRMLPTGRLHFNSG